MRADESSLGGGYGTGTFGWVADLADGPGALAPDVAAGIRLGAWSGNYARGVLRGVITSAVAIARLSLCAPCRPDLLQHQLARVLARESSTDPVHDWPPRDLTASLFAGAIEVTAGRRHLVDPAGHLVTHITQQRGDTIRRTLRVSRGGQQLAEVTTTARLAALQLVDLEQLAEQPAEDAGGMLPFDQ